MKTVKLIDIGIKYYSKDHVFTECKRLLFYLGHWWQNPDVYSFCCLDILYLAYLIALDDATDSR